MRRALPRTRLSVLAVCLAFLVPVAACHAQSPDYYPLQEGMAWQYRVTAGNQMSSLAFVQRVTVLRPRELNNQTVLVQKVELQGEGLVSSMSQLLLQMFVRDTSGIYQVAVQNERDIAPQPHGAKYLVKFPVQVGTTWSGVTNTALLVHPILGQRDKVTVPTTATIESISDTVTVPAGVFEGSVRVRITGTASVKVTPRLTERVSVESHEWYVPGIGLVKQLVKETSDRDGIMPGEALTQLQSFRAK